MVHACLPRSALAPTLRMFTGPAPETEFADGAGDRKSAFFRIPFIGKTRLRSSVRDSSLGEKSKAPSVPAARRKRRRQRPLSASSANRPAPALHQKRSASRVRSGKNGAGARSRSPVRRPRRLQSMFQTPSLLRGTTFRRARLRRLFGTGLLCRNLLGGTRLLDCRLPA